MFAAIRRCIELGGLHRDCRRVVVAVSGGADSVALLWALHRLWRPQGIALVVGHVHHGLRPEEGRRDEQFVAGLASRLDLPFRVERVDTPGDADRTGESLEMAARRLRHERLRRIADDEQADALCLGHTADDQIETLFLRLARGTGPVGLGAMADRCVRDGLPVLRPLLGCRRAQLRAWLASEGLAWCEDASNDEEAIPRNRVRRRLVPAFTDCFGDAAIASAVRTLALCREEERDWLEPWVRSELERVRTGTDPTELDCARLRALPRPLARRVLLAWLHAHQAPAEHQTLVGVERLLALATSPARGTRQSPLGNGTAALRIYERLRYVPSPPAKPADLPEIRVAVPGVTVSTAWNLRIEAVPSIGVVRAPRGNPLAPPFVATLGWDVIAAHGLTLRPVRRGDRLRPVGTKGHRLLSDLLVDRKVPRDRRACVPVIACEDRPVWVPGVAVAADAAVPDVHAASLRLTVEALDGRGTGDLA